MPIQQNLNISLTPSFVNALKQQTHSERIKNYPLSSCITPKPAQKNTQVQVKVVQTHALTFLQENHGHRVDRFFHISPLEQSSIPKALLVKIRTLLSKKGFICNYEVCHHLCNFLNKLSKKLSSQPLAHRLDYLIKDSKTQISILKRPENSPHFDVYVIGPSTQRRNMLSISDVFLSKDSKANMGQFFFNGQKIQDFIITENFGTLATLFSEYFQEENPLCRIFHLKKIALTLKVEKDHQGIKIHLKGHVNPEKISKVLALIPSETYQNIRIHKQTTPYFFLSIREGIKHIEWFISEPQIGQISQAIQRLDGDPIGKLTFKVFETDFNTLSACLKIQGSLEGTLSITLDGELPKHEELTNYPLSLPKNHPLNPLQILENKGYQITSFELVNKEHLPYFMRSGTQWPSWRAYLALAPEQKIHHSFINPRPELGENSYGAFSVAVWMLNNPLRLTNSLDITYFSRNYYNPSLFDEFFPFMELLPPHKRSLFLHKIKENSLTENEKNFILQCQYQAGDDFAQHFLSGSIDQGLEEASYPYYEMDAQGDLQERKGSLQRVLSEDIRLEKDTSSPQTLVELLYAKAFMRLPEENQNPSPDTQKKLALWIVLELIGKASYSKDCTQTAHLKINENISLQQDESKDIHPLLRGPLGKSHVFKMKDSNQLKRYYEHDCFSDAYHFCDTFLFRQRLYDFFNPDSQEILPEDSLEDSERQASLRNDRTQLIIPEDALYAFQGEILSGHMTTYEHFPWKKDLEKMASYLQSRYFSNFLWDISRNQSSLTGYVSRQDTHYPIQIYHFKASSNMEELIQEHAKDILKDLIEETPLYLRPDDLYEMPSYLEEVEYPLEKLPLSHPPTRQKIHKTLLSLTLLKVLEEAKIIEENNLYYLKLTPFITLKAEKSQDLNGFSTCTPHLLSHKELLSSSKDIFEAKKLICQLEQRDFNALKIFLKKEFLKDASLGEDSSFQSLYLDLSLRQLITKIKGALSVTANILSKHTPYHLDQLIKGVHNAPNMDQEKLKRYYRDRGNYLEEISRPQITRNQRVLKPRINLFTGFLKTRLNELKDTCRDDNILFSDKNPLNQNDSNGTNVLIRVNHASAPNCFYNSLLHAILGLPNNYDHHLSNGLFTENLIEDLRTSIANYPSANKEDFLNFFEGNNRQEKIRALQEHQRDINNRGWVDFIGIEISSRLLQRKIEVYENRYFYRLPLRPDSTYGEQFQGEPIRLHFSNHHFNWLAPNHLRQELINKGVSIVDTVLIFNNAVLNL